MLSSIIVAIIAGAVVVPLWLVAVYIKSMGAALIGLLAPLPLFLTGLSYGFISAVIASLFAAISIGILAPYDLGIGFFLMTAIPALLVIQRTMLARKNPSGQVEWYPPGLTITWLVLLGILYFLILVLLFHFTQENGLRDTIQQNMAMITENLAHAFKSAGQDISPEQLKPLTDFIASILPALIVLWTSFIIIFNAILAQGILVSLKRITRPPVQMSDIAIPQWVSLSLGIVGILALVLPGEPGFIATNVAIILALPCLFAGLAVIHAYAHTKQMPGLVLGIFYIVSALFTGLFVLVIGLGIVDEWVGLRQRFVQAAVSKQEKK